MKKISLAALIISGLVMSTGLASAAIGIPPEEEFPTSVAECKQGGWRNFGDLFKNQGDCVSFVATHGKNQPSGPPKQ